MSTKQSVGDLYSAARLAVSNAKAVADLLANAQVAEDESKEAAAYMVWGMLRDAEEHLETLWERIRRKPPDEAEPEHEV